MRGDTELRKYGVRLLDGEDIDIMFDRKRGAVDEVSRMGEGLVLTTHRLIHLDGRRKARASLLTDVHYLEIDHTGRSF